MSARLLLVVLALGALGAACTGDPEPVDAGAFDAGTPYDAGLPTCPDDLPAACPADGGPSYATDVAPIVSQRCTLCHRQGGVEASKPLETYAQVHAQRVEVLDQVYGCIMPPIGYAKPTAEERALLLSWLVCGAQDN